MSQGSALTSQLSNVFDPGKVVQVKSGGPALTVVGPGDDGTQVQCYYFDGKDFVTVSLPMIVLKPGKEVDPQ